MIKIKGIRYRKRPLPHYVLCSVEEDRMGSLIVSPREREEQFGSSAYLQFEYDQESFWEEAAPHSCWSIKSTQEAVSQGYTESVYLHDEYLECLCPEEEIA